MYSIFYRNYRLIDRRNFFRGFFKPKSTCLPTDHVVRSGLWQTAEWCFSVCGRPPNGLGRLSSRPPNDCSACVADRGTIHFFSRHSKTVADRGIKSFRGRGRPRNTFGGLPRTAEYIRRSATHRGKTLFRGMWQDHKFDFTSMSQHFEN